MLDRLYKKLKEYRDLLEKARLDIDRVPEIPSTAEIAETRADKMSELKHMNGVNVDMYDPKAQKIMHERVPKSVADLDKTELIKALDEAGHRESALCLKNWDELDKTAEEFIKSNYGPKGWGLYNPAQNIKRKAKNTGEAVEDAGKNVNVKSYTTSGSTMQQAHEAAQAKEQKKKSKASLRTLADMSPEEKAQMEAKYGAKIKDKE